MLDLVRLWDLIQIKVLKSVRGQRSMMKSKKHQKLFYVVSGDR